MTILPKGLLIATHNKGKFSELHKILSPLGLELFDLSIVDAIGEVEETGSTFLENASLKASAYAKASGLWTLSDDSGLEVEALGGAPGIHSARYAGEGAGDSERIEKLLSEMRASGSDSRSARFVCAVAIADSAGEIRFMCEGECKGTIAESPIGNRGFGYDPIFVPEGFAESFGELPAATKDVISHRARALEKIIPFLLDFKGIVA
jgi:XTP/dITP diphosphohydrolase